MDPEHTTPEKSDTFTAAGEYALLQHTEQAPITEEPASDKQIDELFDKYYTPLDSESFAHEDSTRLMNGKIQVYSYGSGESRITAISSINLDVNNTTISGHEHDPQAESMKDIESQYALWLQSTPLDQRLLIIEGDYTPSQFTDRSDAISQRSEAGLMQFLGEKDGIEIVSGEPTDIEVLEHLDSIGIERTDLAALVIIRSMSGAIANNEVSADDLGLYIYGMVADKIKLDGFKSYTDEEKADIIKSGQLDQMLSEIEDKSRSLIDGINALVQEQLGADLLVVTDGKIKLNLQIDTSDSDAVDLALADLWDPTLQGPLNNVARANSEFRDRILSHKLAKAKQSGKIPLVVFGGSHLVSLDPVLQSIFND